MDWTRNLISPNGGVVGVQPIEQETPKILAGSSRQWHDGAATAKSLAGRTRALSDRVMDVSRVFESAWTGQSADAANAHVTKVGRVLDSTSATLDVNAGNVSSVAESYDYTRNNMVPLPSTPPEAGFWDRAAPWDTDTEDAVNKYNADAQRNLELYRTYAASTEQHGSALQSDYGELGMFDGGDITLTKEPATPPSVHGKTGHPSEQPHQHQQVTSPPSTVPPPAVSSVAPPITVPGGHDTGGLPSREVSGDDTTTAGYVPPAVTPPSLGSIANLPPGPLPGSGVPNTTSPAPYPVGGSGYPGGPGGSGPGSGGVPGDGRRSGVRGGLVEEPVRGGSAGAGRTGGKLNGSPGGLAHGGRGKAEEDREHHRKYVRDDDTLFTEDDREELDPVTGLPPVPPTIGA
ncbi:hypothetical protein [Amycolatopsis sp. NPDC051061]|uniref:PPE domain-containing protein n=1 Tax=Amycolatopsis sp. NPDC051061 TaxID=3155042 RepID=UPI00341D909A